MQEEEADEEDLPDAESEPEEEPDEEKRKKQALAEKDKGNAAYKAKRFDEAIKHYDAAYELYDQDISFITNRQAHAVMLQSNCGQDNICGSLSSGAHMQLSHTRWQEARHWILKHQAGTCSTPTRGRP